MMNFEEFLNYVEENIKGYLPEEYREAKIEKVTATKNNGVVLKGISIRHQQSEIAPNIYLESLYEQYMNNMSSLCDVMKSIVDVFLKAMDNVPFFPYKKLLNWENVKERVILQVVNKESNEALLDIMPHHEFEDLAIIYRIAVGEMGEEYATVPIYNNLLEMWGKITADDLLKHAKENTRRILPFEVKTMRETLLGLYERMEDDDEHLAEKLDEGAIMPPDLYVVSNVSKCFGAATILYEDVYAELAQKVGTNLYIIPSSIHECLAISADSAEVEDMLSIIKDVNECQLSPEEILSYNLYYYDAQARKISLVEVDRNKISA